jgi:hypothetical protein
MAYIDLTAFGVAVGTTVLAVEVEIKNLCQ